MMKYLVSCQDIDMEIETFFGRRHKFAGSLENEFEEEYLLRTVCGHYVVQGDDCLLVADEGSLLQHGVPSLAPAVLVTHGRGS